MKAARSRLVAAAGMAALIVLGGTRTAYAQTGGPGSPGGPSGSGSGGGPGGLGTSAPRDSTVARTFMNYSLPTNTASAKRVHESVEKLHGDYQSIIQTATAAQAAPGVNDDQKKAARELVTDAQRDDQTLVQIAAEQGFDVHPVTALAAQQGAGGTGSAASGEPSLSDVARLSQDASKDAADLHAEAKKGSRDQLASFSSSTSRTFGVNASAMAASSVLGTGAGSASQ